MDGGALTEKLTLTDANPGGTWTVSIQNLIAELVVLEGQSVDENGNLTFTDKNKELPIKLAAIPPTAAEGEIIDLSTVGGTTTLHVEYKEQGGKTFTHDYTLRVTAELKLKPAQVTLFPTEVVMLSILSDDTETANKLCVTVTNRNDEDLTGSELKLTGVQSGDTVRADPKVYDEGGVGTFKAIQLTGGAEPTATPEIIGVNYRFTYDGKTYATAGSILAEVLPVDMTVTPEETQDGVEPKNYTVSFDFGKDRTVTDFQATLAEETAVTLTAKDGTTVLLTLPDTPADQTEASAPDNQTEAGTPPDDQTEPDTPADQTEPDTPADPKPVTRWTVKLHLSFQLDGQPHAFDVTVTVPPEPEEETGGTEAAAAQSAAEEAALPAGENKMTLTLDVGGQPQELEVTVEIPPVSEDTPAGYQQATVKIPVVQDGQYYELELTLPFLPMEEDTADQGETNPEEAELPEESDPAALPAEPDAAALLPTQEEAEPEADPEKPKPDGEEDQAP